ncbi:MAG: heavy metal-binding domain-containing protein [Bacteroidota bacterium]
MKKLILIGIVAVLFCFAACRENHSGHQHHQDSKDTTHQHMEGEQASILYQCPMKCEGDKTYDKPGSCPICKMDLKEVE